MISGDARSRTRRVGGLCPRTRCAALLVDDATTFRVKDSNLDRQVQGLLSCQLDEPGERHNRTETGRVVTCAVTLAREIDALHFTLVLFPVRLCNQVMR